MVAFMAASIKSPYALAGNHRFSFHTWHDLYAFPTDDLEQYSSLPRTRSQHLINTILDGSSKALLAPGALQYKLAWGTSPIGSDLLLIVSLLCLWTSSHRHR
jgi:hypothetical protein